jgi:RNA polymerase sigma factor (sigma-70 family)
LPNQLIAAPPSQSADPQDFAALYEKYKKLVFKTAYLILGEANEAEEALQEIFLLVYRSLGQYDAQKGALSTWLHRITLNYCLSYRRKPHLAEEPLEATYELAAEPENDPQSWTESEPIYQAIRELSKKQKAVIILRYYWDLPYAEIAQILKIPLGTVKSRIVLALQTLRRELGGNECEKDNGPQLPANEEVKNEM